VHTLLDFFDRYVHGETDALIYDDGFRRWSYTGDQVRATAEAFAGRLNDAGLRAGDRFVIWSDNRPEWVAAFWGCLLRGVVVVPIDARASADLFQRIVAAAGPRGVLVDDERHTPALPPSVFAWRLGEIRWFDPCDGAASRIEGGEAAQVRRAPVNPDTIAEIVFTSGTTGSPKGVLITHRNIVANITPIEREVSAYRRYIWLFRPIRFLGLLPLSHMFGQALTIFLPPLVRAAVVFVKGYNPDEIVAQVRRHRITLVVTVPRVLEMLRDRVRRLASRCAHPTPAQQSLPRRLWRYREAHRLLGWKCGGFVVGGAPLEPELERFWRALGFAVIQGYGLTETAPIVAWNNPFRQRHGTVGLPLEGIDVRIAPDGEILVRGPTVTTGYLNAPDETQMAFEAGWFRTGDLGSFDESGHLVIRGRKKDAIVTPEGVNVFPEDVERVLESLPGVREAAVVGRVNGAERVHAVLVFRADTDPAVVVRDANTRLESHQRIRDFSVWPGPALPRTEAIGKLKRAEIRAWVAEGAPRGGPVVRAAADDVERLLARYVQNRPAGPDTTLDELGLTSLDRIELTMALEDQSAVRLAEEAVAAARTVGDLRHLVQQSAEAGPPPEPFSFPRWNRSWLARMLRNGSQALWILPLAGLFMRRRVEGREHFDRLSGPLIFAANHQSLFDTPAILASVPHRWRRVLAVPMAKENFDAHFFPARHTVMQRVAGSAIYYLAALFFNGFPLPRTEPGVRVTLRYMGELATSGLSVLIFPEGHYSERGEIRTFQQGVGMMASRLRLPVVPVRLEGLERVLQRTWRWPRRGGVRVAFGAPLRLEGDDYAALAHRVEQAVIALGALPEEHRCPGKDAA
jgi:long-chain acyl-CoA synthetase